MERFSAFFNGPLELFYDNELCVVEHDRMGAFELFWCDRQDRMGFGMRRCSIISVSLRTPLHVFVSAQSSIRVNPSRS